MFITNEYLAIYFFIWVSAAALPVSELYSTIHKETPLSVVIITYTSFAILLPFTVLVLSYLYLTDGSYILVAPLVNLFCWFIFYRVLRIVYKNEE